MFVAWTAQLVIEMERARGEAAGVIVAAAAALEAARQDVRDHEGFDTGAVKQIGKTMPFIAVYSSSCLRR